ncbi:hypothetical protein GCM10023195_20430 [Actinoallomurus liliacearum]|uniref:Uncharacterized protein n=1 Tax=Actinoallomurus liliacearum TaxID=1080073 RepID=A0ABP8TE06_9ACTN
MAMIRVPVDALWVRRMAELADAPWSEEALIAAFERFGWTGAVQRSEPDGPPRLPWCDWADLLPEQGGRTTYSGWTMYFYEPSDADSLLNAGIALVCGSFWPPCGEDDTGVPDPFAAAGRDEFLNNDEWAVWVTDPTARRAEFVAEFDRIEALARDVCGEPTRTLRDERGIASIWERGGAALSLMAEPNEWDYEAYDWITLRVIPVP